MPLWEGYNAFYGREGATAVPGDVTRVTWARFFDPLEPMHALVAERDGALLGLVHYLFHRSTVMIAPDCYLRDLFTVPAARGKGVGRALILGVYEAARGVGVDRVYWHTQTGNAAGRLLYDKVATQTTLLVYRQML